MQHHSWAQRGRHEHRCAKDPNHRDDDLHETAIEGAVFSWSTRQPAALVETRELTA